MGVRVETTASSNCKVGVSMGVSDMKLFVGGLHAIKIAPKKNIKIFLMCFTFLFLSGYGTTIVPFIAESIYPGITKFMYSILASPAGLFAKLP